MRSISFIILFAMLMEGCASSIIALHEASTNTASKPVSIQEAFSGAEKHHFGMHTNIYVSTGQVPLVSLDNYNLLVIPLLNDGSRPHTIKVKSYVARKNDGTSILFYPVLSFVDQSFHVYLTVKPKYEFVFDKNVLTNEFEVPAGVERLLIHTDKEFFRGSFEGVASVGGKEGSPVGAYAGAAPFFGVLGALGVVVSHTEIQGEKFPFKFDEMGVVNIEAY
jgi:hypothetical protein